MLYNNILIDSANLFYRLAKKDDNFTTIIKKMIAHVEEETKAHLEKDGTIYILFDPITLSDLGESKSFKFLSYKKIETKNDRKQKSKDYKSGRVYNPNYQKTIETFLKYYAYRGEQIKLVYSNKYEADDFVEPLLKQLSGKIALVSNDEDFARYIDENTYLISRGYDDPFNKKEFYDKFKFFPTPAANTLYKAFFGDTSDKITGCIFLKKAKFMTNIKMLCYDYIKEVSDKNISLDDVVKQFRNGSFNDYVEKDDTVRTPFERLFTEFSIASQKESVLSKFYLNVDLIRSHLENKPIDKYIHWNDEKPVLNDVIRQAIYGMDSKSWFGKK